jgi:hypothetical protein
VSQPEPSARPRQSAAGTAALLIIGLVVLLPSGLCTGIFGGGALIDGLLHPENIRDSLSILVMATVFGGPFVAIGGVMVWFGVKRLRRS